MTRISADLSNAGECDRLAIEAHQTGRHRDAIELAGRAVFLEPGAPAYRVKLGALLCSAGRPADALVHLAEGLRLNGSLPELHNNLGIAFRHLGWIQEAIGAFRTALELRPGYAEALFNLAGALRKGGDALKAAGAYEQLLGIHSDYAPALVGLGDIWAEYGRQDSALAALRRVTALQPHNVSGHSDLLFTMHYALTVSPGERQRQHCGR